MPALVEHLRARLGTQAVYGIRRVAEHRPEHAWCVAEPAMQAAAAPAAATPAATLPVCSRPLWLLHAPRVLEVRTGRPRHDGELQLLRGPERIQSGWWDGDDIQRDYYVARDASGALLWICRECHGEQRWLLQGIFG
jgi:protein ImuB